MPYFDENDSKFENSRRIVGIRVNLGDCSLALKNPDFSEEVGDLKSSQGQWIRSKDAFNYTNKFTNTRFSYLSGPYQGFICEVWFKAELTQYADHKLTNFFGPQDHLFRDRVLNHALSSGLNSVLVLEPDCLINASIFYKIVSDSNFDGQEDPRWFGPPQNLFAPIDFLNGYSIMEFFCESGAFVDAIKYSREESCKYYYNQQE